MIIGRPFNEGAGGGELGGGGRAPLKSGSSFFSSFKFGAPEAKAGSGTGGRVSLVNIFLISHFFSPETGKVSLMANFEIHFRDSTKKSKADSNQSSPLLFGLFDYQLSFSESRETGEGEKDEKEEIGRESSIVFGIG